MLHFINRAFIAKENLQVSCKKFVQSESGATAIEYGLIAAGISVAVIGTVFTLGGDINTAFTTVQTEIAGAKK